MGKTKYGTGYPEELRARAVRMVLDHEGEYASRSAAILSISQKVGCSRDSLRIWVKQHEMDTCKRDGVTTAERDRIKELERENRQLRQAKIWGKNLKHNIFFPIKAAVTAGLLTISLAAEAQENPGEFAVSLGAASVGLTGEVAYRVNDKWRVRGMLSGAPTYRGDDTLGGIRYDVKARLQGLTLLADYVPFNDRRWRLSLGAFLSDSSAEGTATGNLQIGDNTYSTTLSAEIEFENKVSPILAIGFDQPLGNQWFIGASAGYIYTGGMNVSLNSSNPILPGDLLKEVLQSEADFNDGYPFVELGIYYRF